MNPFGFAIGVPQGVTSRKPAQVMRRGPQDMPSAPFGFVPAPSKVQQTLEILNEYNPLPMFERLMKSPMASGGEITDQNIADGLGITMGLTGASAFAPKPTNALNMGIKAFHGSPHSFDRFDMSKIGTGEGAQAYGHGLYFAEAEDVAKGYRDALSRQTSYNGQPVGNMHPSDSDAAAAISSISKHVADGVDPSEAMRLEAIKWRQSAEPYVKFANENPEHAALALESAKSFTRVADEIERLDPQKFSKNPGHMYEVNINADPDTFLDWDKPLSEQPEAVKKVLRPLVGDSLEAQPGRDYQTGEQFYRDFVGKIGGQRDKLISKYGDEAYFRNAGDLANRELGIPGIKYLDAGSRGAGDGTRNYVVFDDRLIEIVRKYGIAGASAMLGYNILDGMDPAQADELKRIEGNQ